MGFFLELLKLLGEGSLIPLFFIIVFLSLKWLNDLDAKIRQISKKNEAGPYFLFAIVLSSIMCGIVSTKRMNCISTLQDPISTPNTNLNSKRLDYTEVLFSTRFPYDYEQFAGFSQYAEYDFESSLSFPLQIWKVKNTNDTKKLYKIKSENIVLFSEESNKTYRNNYGDENFLTSDVNPDTFVFFNQSKFYVGINGAIMSFMVKNCSSEYTRINDVTQLIPFSTDSCKEIDVTRINNARTELDKEVASKVCTGEDNKLVDAKKCASWNSNLTWIYDEYCDKKSDKKSDSKCTFLELLRLSRKQYFLPAEPISFWKVATAASLYYFEKNDNEGWVSEEWRAADVFLELSTLIWIENIFYGSISILFLMITLIIQSNRTYRYYGYLICVLFSIGVFYLRTMPGQRIKQYCGVQ